MVGGMNPITYILTGLLIYAIMAVSTWAIISIMVPPNATFPKAAIRKDARLLGLVWPATLVVLVWGAIRGKTHG